MDILSGNLFETNEVLSKVQRNLSFRVSSARKMLTGVRGESEMSPMSRRKQIREHRLDLLGIKSDSEEDVSSSSSPSRSYDTSGSSSQDTSEDDPGRISTTSTSGYSGTDYSGKHRIESMSEVARGTRDRAENNGFSDPS